MPERGWHASLFLNREAIRRDGLRAHQPQHAPSEPAGVYVFAGPLAVRTALTYSAIHPQFDLWQIDLRDLPLTRDERFINHWLVTTDVPPDRLRLVHEADLVVGAASTPREPPVCEQQPQPERQHRANAVQ